LEVAMIDGKGYGSGYGYGSGIGDGWDEVTS
jgi:hypothetical protein